MDGAPDPAGRTAEADRPADVTGRRAPDGDAPATSAASRGRLIVLAGPSGVGKSSVVAGLREQLPELHFSVSATTRGPRAGEVDGRDYRFVSATEFDGLIARGELLEWAEIHGGLQRSGTPAAPVEQARAAGRPVLVEVDLQGARAVKAAIPDALTVFVDAPSFEELARRLKGRGTESAAQFERRLQTAREELAARDEFDVVVVNDDLRAVVDRLVGLAIGPTPPESGRGGQDDDLSPQESFQ